MPVSGGADPNAPLSDTPEQAAADPPSGQPATAEDAADEGGVQYSEPVYVEVITEESVEYVPPAAPPAGSEIPGKDDYLLTAEESDEEFPIIEEQEPGTPPQSDSIDDEGSEDGSLWPDDSAAVPHDTHPLPAPPGAESEAEDNPLQPEER